MPECDESMKCDGYRCTHEATIFEKYPDDYGGDFLKYCSFCLERSDYQTRRNAVKMEIMTREEFIAFQVMHS